jgi:uncharacterized protein (DUF305 family)
MEDQMSRNVKIAAGVAALGLVGAGVAVAAGAPGFGPGGSQHPRFAAAGTGLAGTMSGRGMPGTGMGQAGQGPRMGGMGPGAGAGMHGGRMARMGIEVESEFGYLTQMIPHHEEAIAAAEVLQQGTERQEMRDFAASIIETQTAEVEQMEQWLAAWYPGRDTSVDYEPMMRDLSGLSGDALDRAFLQDMVPHHMMAVMMSQQLVWGDLAQHDAVVPFAENIRDTQHEEIRTMAGWLADWFGDRPMGRGMHR